MNALARILLAGVASAMLLTSVAIAQNSESVDANTAPHNGAVSSIETFSDLLSSIAADNDNVSNIADVKVSFVDIGEAFTDFDAVVLHEVIDGNDAVISDLENKVSRNPTLSDALSVHDIDVSNVVALDNHDNGAVTIYTYRQN